MQDVTSEFPFVAEMPKRQQGFLRTMWEVLGELSELQKTVGGCFPISLAADALGVSRSRVHQLIQDGRLEAHRMGSQLFVTHVSLIEFAKVERLTGRPSKDLEVCGSVSKVSAPVTGKK
jgi:excisionase family DNA binding protein